LQNTQKNAFKRAGPFRTGSLGGGGLLERLYFYRRPKASFVAQLSAKFKKTAKKYFEKMEYDQKTLKIVKNKAFITLRLAVVGCRKKYKFF